MVTVFDFSFDVPVSWHKANYFVRAVVRDDGGVVHDSATAVLGVGSTPPLIVPELDFLLVLLIHLTFFHTTLHLLGI